MLCPAQESFGSLFLPQIPLATSAPVYLLCSGEVGVAEDQYPYQDQATFSKWPNDSTAGPLGNSWNVCAKVMWLTVASDIYF